MNIHGQYHKETGKKWEVTVTDGVHSVPAITVPSYDYVEWLENKLIDIRKTIFYGTKALSDVTNDMQDTIRELSEDE